MLVSKLIEAIRQDKAEAEKAALTLGLLIEREKVYHPIAADDEGIKQILDEEFVQQRLSKSELNKAIDDLILYISETPVPRPMAIWALTKSYDPRILPPLIDLLDRFIDDPNKEELVYQALIGIMNFYDSQSLSAVHRAATRGHGKVKDTATNYLKRNLGQIDINQKFPPHKYVDTPDNEFDVEGEIYILQRLPRYPYIAMNYQYRGIRVVDPWNGKDILHTEFTKRYDNSGIINGWCFRSDGTAVLVVNEKSRTASLLSLEVGGLSYDLQPPPLPQINDLRYIWEDESFWITGGNSFAFFNLQSKNGQLIFMERGSIHARVAHRAWCKALDQLHVLHSQVLRVEPDKYQILYSDFSTDALRIGVLNWHDNSNWSIPASGYVPITAFYKAHLFLMYDHEVHVVNHEAQVETIYSVPKDFYCRGLDIVLSSGNYPDALVLACSSLGDSEQSRILVYSLED